MAGLNRTDYELQQMIAALPSQNRGLLQEILFELANGSSQRAFSATSVNGTTLSAAELAFLDSVTAGTVAASKAVVVSSNKDAGTFRKVTLEELVMATNAATATGGAATLAKKIGKITTEGLTTAGQADYTLTLTNSTAAAADYCFASVANGTNTQGTPVVSTVLTAANTITIKVNNAHASQALNGTLVISFFLVSVT